MKKILFITNIPSPYRVLFFNELAKKCELTVVYEKNFASDRDSKWNENSNREYNSVFLNGHSYKTDSAYSSKIKTILKEKSWDFIVFCNFTSLTGIVGINYCIKHHIKYCLEGDGAFYNKQWLKDIIKKRVISHAEYCFSTCKNLDNYFENYGAKRDRIIRYHFSSQTEEDLSINRRMSESKLFYKEKLGLSYKKVVLCVGQFIYRKGIDLLIEAAKQFTDIYFLVVGGEATEEYKKQAYGMLNIEFIPFKSKKDLKEYYAASDLFVLPTREDIWGLVINEAMSFGLPVVTTTRCNAGIELLRNGEFGYIIAPDNVEELVNIISVFNFETNSIMKDQIFDKIREYSIEQMVLDHTNFFDKKI